MAGGGYLFSVALRRARFAPLMTPGCGLRPRLSSNYKDFPICLRLRSGRFNKLTLATEGHTRRRGPTPVERVTAAARRRAAVLDRSLANR